MNRTGSEVPTDSNLFAVKPEFALLVAGAVLTLLVIGFVAMLIRSIVKEQREEARRNEQERPDA